LLLSSCDKTEKLQRVSNSPVLAEVGYAKLYLDELVEGGLMMSAVTTEDSTQIKNAYIQKWIKDQLMLQEAEKSLAGDIDIDMLVQDYKESLILYNYENNLVGDQLDTTITGEQIKQYYDEHIDNFQLAESILRCRVAVIDGKKPKLDRFYANWKAEKMESVNTYIQEHASISMMNEDKWYSSDEILTLLPKKIDEKDLKTKKTIQEAKEGNEYFVKILEYIDKSEDPPLAYVSSNIKKIILRQRKTKLILRLKEDLYQREISGNKVKIYR